MKQASIKGLITILCMPIHTWLGCRKQQHHEQQQQRPRSLRVGEQAMCTARRSEQPKASANVDDDVGDGDVDDYNIDNEGDDVYDCLCVVVRTSGRLLFQMQPSWQDRQGSRRGHGRVLLDRLPVETKADADREVSHS